MDEKILPAAFYRTEAGNEPVRDWLKELDKDDRLEIGTDIKTVEFGWPIGMPTCRSLGKGLYEVRSNLPSNRIARTIFCIHDRRILTILYPTIFSRVLKDERSVKLHCSVFQ